MRSFVYLVLVLASLAIAPTSSATDYIIDTKGAHAFVQFRVKHMGFSWLYGRFNNFSGEFKFDPDKPENNLVSVTIQMKSVDTNHARRDKHIRSEDFLSVNKYPVAIFDSKSYKSTGKKTGELTGDLIFMGKTKPVTIELENIGYGEDGRGGYRAGFEGRATIDPNDWGLPMAEKLGPASQMVELFLSVEGIRQDKTKK